ncbi:hypothetical protein [Vulcanococcus sp.]|uniref:hypothetical protein n=1 Tax=Vulcanococcus sp. TaxID=2856995 RepID=UPI003F69E395
MIEPDKAITSVNSLPSQDTAGADAPDQPALTPPPASDPVLCGHCGRTASNGLVCIGMCVADSGY